ncbi:MAG: hypothetical protein EOL97_08570 [Spirochaetia bacterium]|nr:hypothetical protein [Spirochaetia bacterium]
MDFLQQCSDVVIAYNKPSKYNLALYGPEKFIIDNPNLIAAHVLKNRMGTNPILWYLADYPTMSFNEVESPQRKEWQS